MIRNKELKILVTFLLAVCTVFSAICFAIDILLGIVSIAALVLPFIAFYIFTNHRYKNISKLSAELNKIANGEFSMDVRNNEEGELSILRNEVYKVIVNLTEQTAILEKDITRLADNLSDISHQLKTPLTSLLVMSELLEKNDLPIEKRKEFRENIGLGLRRMEWLVLSLLKIAKLDANAVILQKEIVGAEDIIKMAIQALDIILTAKKQSVVMTGEEDVLFACDINWTVEALTNIVKNASEYSPENSVISISWKKNPLSVQIAVEDRGGGISEKDLPHLFQRFYKGNKASKESAGIGLALSLEIMHKQSGDIDVINKIGEGAVFVLKFYGLK